MSWNNHFEAHEIQEPEMDGDLINAVLTIVFSSAIDIL
jgi:hypothetical protein